MQNQKVHLFSAVFGAALIALGLILGGVEETVRGFVQIATMPSLLITDYYAAAGVGAALCNGGVLTLMTLVLLRLSKSEATGFTIAEVGLMAGFSLFGKNYVNVLPIWLGTWLYSRWKKEPFSKHTGITLLATALGPLVTHMAFHSNWASIPAGILTGVFMGFALPALAAHTSKLQNGMNLYNMGFACGLMGLMLVSILRGTGEEITTASFWGTGSNLPMGVFLGVLCAIFILGGLFFSGLTPGQAWAGYRNLMRTTGRPPMDYLKMFGSGPVLINMGINGLIGTAYFLSIGGDLNGPTIGGIFTVIGFSAYGKHFCNIVPVIGGLALGGAAMAFNLTDPGLQIAAMFCTTLAPVAGCFGWPYGVIAGFIHASVVRLAGAPLCGMNLYNNGFCGGLIVIVLFPLIQALLPPRPPRAHEEDAPPAPVRAEQTTAK